MFSYQNSGSSCNSYLPTAHHQHYHLLEHHQLRISKYYKGMKYNKEKHKNYVLLATDGSLLVINVKDLNSYLSRAPTTPMRTLVKNV